MSAWQEEWNRLHEIDVKIAKIKGSDLKHDEPYYYENKESSGWACPECGCNYDGHGVKYSEELCAPRYSSDYELAFGLVKEMTTNGWKIEMAAYPNGSFFAKVHDRIGEEILADGASDNSLAEAICQAWLKVNE